MASQEPVRAHDCQSRTLKKTFSAEVTSFPDSQDMTKGTHRAVAVLAPNQVPDLRRYMTPFANLTLTLAREMRR
jgi:hypothetical protein